MKSNRIRTIKFTIKIYNVESSSENVYENKTIHPIMDPQEEKKKYSARNFKKCAIVDL